MMKRFISTTLLVLAALWFAACGEAPVGPQPEPDPDPQPITIALSVIAGADQADTVMKELGEAVVVQTTDSKTQAAVSGVLVNFVVTAGGGTVFAGSAISNGNGEARERWFLGPDAGTQTLEARAVDQTTGEALTYAVISAQALPDKPADVLGLDGKVLIGHLGDSLTLPTTYVVDQYNNWVQTAVVTWAANSNAVEVVGDTVVLLAEADIDVEVLVNDERTDLFVGIMSMYDLTTFDWLVTYACKTDWRADKDSITVEAVVDSVFYDGEITGYWLFSGWSINWYADGTVDSLALPKPDDGVGRSGVKWNQYVGALEWRVPYIPGFQWKTADTPLTYEGGSFCPQPELYTLREVVAVGQPR